MRRTWWVVVVLVGCGQQAPVPSDAGPAPDAVLVYRTTPSDIVCDGSFAECPRFEMAGCLLASGDIEWGARCNVDRVTGMYQPWCPSGTPRCVTAGP